MKKKATRRIIGIGIFHSVLYLYVVPFLIYPHFGRVGFQFVVATAIIVSFAVLVTMFTEKTRGDKNGEY